MFLSRFQWYRRARGGYWAQVIGLLWGKRWIRSATEPSPNHEWVFYPWGTKIMGNGYIDEWYTHDCYAVPLSSVICEDCKTRLNK